MKSITAYRCDHCPKAKIAVTERSMKTHEANCIHNPDVRSCPTCVHDGYQCREGWRQNGENLIRRCVHYVQGVAE